MNALLILLASLSITEAQVITVGPDRFIITFTLETPGPATVIYGRDPDRLDQSRSLPERTRFQVAEVSGLEPGADYYYRVTAGCGDWPSPRRPPAHVSTLRAPPGRRLFSFAVMSDIHAGQDINSLMVPPLPFLPPTTPGFTWKYPVDNYWDFTLRSAVEGVNQSGAAFCVVTGDLTSWYLEREFRFARDRLDRLTVPYYVARGNHDRQGEEPEDWFKKIFALDPTWQSFDHGGCHFVVLDDNNPQNGFARIGDAQMTWLAADLASRPAAPTFILSHHPWILPSPDQNPAERRRFLELIDRNTQIAAVIAGHTHRAAILFPDRGRRPFIEVASTSEYPVGFGLFTVYEGGFDFQFRPLTCPDCREWDHETRKAYYGQAPKRMARSLADRSLMLDFPAGLKLSAP